MKNLLIVGSILFSTVVVANGHSNEETLRKGINSLTEQARDLKLNVTNYKSAVDQFYRLDFGDIHDVKKLSEYSELEEAMALLSQDQELSKELNKKVASIMKAQNRQYAKILGIPESKVREFIEYVKNLEVVHNSGRTTSPEAKEAGVLSNFNTYGMSGDDEVITVTCNLQCQRQAQLNEFYKALYFREWALQSGVGQYETFHVGYSADGDSEEAGSVEAWRYNNYSGAWKMGIISVCGDVICKR